MLFYVRSQHSVLGQHTLPSTTLHEVLTYGSKTSLFLILKGEEFCVLSRCLTKNCSTNPAGGFHIGVLFVDHCSSVPLQLTWSSAVQTPASHDFKNVLVFHQTSYLGRVHTYCLLDYVIILHIASLITYCLLACILTP